MKKGFTLIELLGVLIILAVIALITFPVIDNSIKSSREKSLERTIESIEEAAYRYSIENDIGYPSEQQVLYLSDIQSKGFLSSSIINPVTNEELAGCVWYYWNTNYNQYVFEYDMECIKVDTEPVINIIYDESLINNNGWAKENIAATLSGNGEIKYCISNSECKPNEIISDGNNTKFITTEGTSYLCALTTNSLGNSETSCQSFQLDKTLPTINGVGDLTVQLNEPVNLSANVTYNDALSGIDGELSITPSTIDTSTTGTKQVAYKVQDKAGNVREVVRNIIVDADAPTIVFNLVDSSAINSNGWAKSNFYLRATITDNSGSGIASASSCTTNSSSECTPSASFTGTTKDFYIESEGSNRACISVTDNNNRTTKVCSNTYNLDKTVPTVGTATFDGTLGSNSWYTSNVTINVANGSDSLSGHDSTISSVASITSNTTETVVTITTTDLAGNSATRNYTIKVDKNSPTLTAKDGTVEITEGDSNVVSNYFNVSYSISGGSISCNPTNTSTLTAGSQMLSCTVTGGNGKTASASKEITIIEPIILGDISSLRGNFTLAGDSVGHYELDTFLDEDLFMSAGYYEAFDAIYQFANDLDFDSFIDNVNYYNLYYVGPEFEYVVNGSVQFLGATVVNDIGESIMNENGEYVLQLHIRPLIYDGGRLRILTFSTIRGEFEDSKIEEIDYENKQIKVILQDIYQTPIFIYLEYDY